MVFLFVVFLVGYIMVKNERKIERFVDRIAGSPLTSKDVDSTQRETIVSVFRNYLNREPTEEEIASYSRVMLNSNDVMSLIDAVKASDDFKMTVDKTRVNTDPSTNEMLLDASEIKDSPLLKDIKKVSFDKRLDTYRQVIDIYVKVLERMPTNKELVYYSHRMLTDKEFTEDKLARILESSNERKILENNQTNVVNAQLPGNITHAQMEMDVTNKYKSLYNVEPPQEVVDFLIHKYQDYKLDEKKLDKLLLLMNDIDVLETQKNSKTSSTSTTKDNSTDDPSKEKTIVKNDSKEKATSEGEASLQHQQNIYQNPNIINIIATKPEDIDEIVKQMSSTPNSTTVINKNIKYSDTQQAKLCKADYYEDPFYKALAKQQGACKFNSDVSLTKDRMSEYQAKRNQDEVSMACRRNMLEASYRLLFTVRERLYQRHKT